MLARSGAEAAAMSRIALNLQTENTRLIVSIFNISSKTDRPKIILTKT
jgi:hypothetical protein